MIGSNQRFRVQFEIILHEWAFWKTHKCKLILNWTRKTMSLLINNVNIKTFAWRKCRTMFLKAFFPFEKTFCQSFRTKSFHQFAWYYWLRKVNIALWKTYKCKSIPNWTRKPYGYLNNIKMKKIAGRARDCQNIFVRADLHGETVACDKLTTRLLHKLFRANQTYNSPTTVVYVTKNVVGF